MALNAYAELTLDGNALSGDVSLSTLGGVDVSSDHIECFEVRWGARWGAEVREQRTVSRTARPEPSSLLPVSLLKPVDRTTPLFYRGLRESHRVSGDIKLFDNDPDSGETRHRFTIRITDGRIQSIQSVSPDALDPALANRLPSETVEILPRIIAYMDEIDGIEYEDGNRQV